MNSPDASFGKKKLPDKDSVLKEGISDELIKVFSGIRTEEEMASFFREIFTPAEIRDLAMRWQLLRELFAGETQRNIAARHRLSLCKITRGSKILKKKKSATLALLKKHYGGK